LLNPDRTVTLIIYFNIIIYYTYIVIGGIPLNTEDLTKLMNNLSKMDKKDLQEYLLKASNLLNTKDIKDIKDE